MKIRISVSIWALLLLLAAYYFGAWQIILLMFFAAAIHELGHCAALKLCGGTIIGIRLEFCGFVIRGAGIKSYAGEAITAAAGPAASLLLAVICAFAGRLFEFRAAYSAAGMSFVFFAFNLLPVFPLDGGRILYNILARRLSLTAADRITCAAGCAVLFLMLCAGMYILIVTGRNFSLLLVALYLLVCYCKNGNNGIKSVV